MAQGDCGQKNGARYCGPYGSGHEAHSGGGRWSGPRWFSVAKSCPGSRRLGGELRGDAAMGGTRNHLQGGTFREEILRHLPIFAMSMSVLLSLSRRIRVLVS